MTQLVHHRFSAEDYHRMAEAGVLGEDDRVELIEGEIVEMAPVGSRHASAVMRMYRFLQPVLGDSAVVWVQNPIRLSDLSEPEPDIALLRPRADDYATGHPGPADILLVIEVADTTLAYDRNVKLPLYAASGIAEAWLVDLEGREVEVWSEPGPAGYGRSGRVGAEGSITATTLPTLTVPAAVALT